MKIAFITPFPPYRGGISKSSEDLFIQISKSHKIKIFNFKRQYPKIFFPGKNQYLTDNYSNYNMDRIIDSINPLTWKKTAEVINKNKIDRVIFRYWNPFFIPCYTVIIKILKKMNKNIKIFALCDNIVPHENFLLQKIATKFFIKKLDGVLVMSENVKNELINLVPNCSCKKTFLPIINYNKSILTQNDARNKLKFKNDLVIFMFFGLIRKYKGIDILLKSINKINPNLKDKYKCLIVGESYENIQKYKTMLKDELKINVEWINEYIPNEKVDLYFSASDFIVLPYKTASQSAVVPLSYSYNKPVIVSDLIGLSEFVENNKTGYIFKNSNINNLSKILTNIILNKNFDHMSNEINKIKNNFSIEKLSNEIISFID